MKMRKLVKIKSFAGLWRVCGRVSKTDRTVLPSYRGKILCLNSGGTFYYANPSEIVLEAA